jgi:hypothetical protein
VSEDNRPERVVLLQRDLVVFGPGFRGGARYEFITLGQFEKASDISEVTAKDLTGDGNAEIIVRGVRRAKLGSDPVFVDVVMIYSVTKDGIRRVFAGETARAIGDKRVQNVMQFVPVGKTFDIDMQAGKATGFDKRSYPFQDESVDGVDSVLLPWGTSTSRRYTWDGAKFVRK